MYLKVSHNVCDLWQAAPRWPACVRDSFELQSGRKHYTSTGKKIWFLDFWAYCIWESSRIEIIGFQSGLLLYGLASQQVSTFHDSSIIQGHLILPNLASISTEAGTLLLNEFNDFVAHEVSVQDGLQSSKLLFGHKDV